MGGGSNSNNGVTASEEPPARRQQRRCTTASNCSWIPKQISVYSSSSDYSYPFAGDDELAELGANKNNNCSNYGSIITTTESMNTVASSAPLTTAATASLSFDSAGGSAAASTTNASSNNDPPSSSSSTTEAEAASSASAGSFVVVTPDDDDDEEAHQQLQEHHDNDDILFGSSNRNNNNNSNSNSNKLSTMGLAIIVFYNVSGGPFGVEASVRGGGSFYALLGFLVFPFIWSVQESLMTAELASTFPEASGGVAWVETAFGTRAGFMAGYLSWVAGATDNAIYPVLFLDYLLEVVGGGSGSSSDDDDDDTGSSMHSMTRWILLSTTSAVLAYVNWKGLRVVETMSFGICLIAMSPFIVMIIVGSFQIDASRWFEMPSSIPAASQENATYNSNANGDDDYVLGTGWTGGGGGGGTGLLLRPLLNNLFWNLNSFDSAASYSGDIRGDPGQVMPRALGWALLLTALGYLFPLLIAIGATDSNQHDWVDGYLAKAASDIAGPWLGAWTVWAAGISNIALFQAELSSDALQLMGMADRGHIPSIFSTRSRHGTPTYGIILGTAVIIIMSVSELDDLIEMLNFNYAISLIMEYLAFFKLRTSRPDLHRPYQIPLNTCWCMVLFAPTLFFTFTVLCLASFKTYLFSFGANAFGLLLYAIMSPRREEEGEGYSPTSQFCLSQLCLKKKYTPVDTDNTSTTMTMRSANEDTTIDASLRESSMTPLPTITSSTTTPMHPASHPVVEAAIAGGTTTKNTII